MIVSSLISFSKMRKESRVTNAMIRQVLQRLLPVVFLNGLLCTLTAAEPLDLFADAPRLAPGLVRLGAWNLRHINVEGGADEVLPGVTREEDFDLLIGTFAKAINDLGLDIVAVIEHQPHPGEPNRLQQIAERLNAGNGNHWQFTESNIEYDEPYHPDLNPFGGLQFGLLWNTAHGVKVNGAECKVLNELRQPRDANGQLTERKTRAPWFIPVQLSTPTGGSLNFDLIVLHLKSGGVVPQAAEVEALTKFMRQHLASVPQRHLVVCGDWNIRPDQDIQGQGRPRLKKMMLPTANSSLMRILTVTEMQPHLDEWERIDDLVGNLGQFEPLKTVLPYSHLPDGDTDPYTLLDHIAISRSLSEVFDNPVEVTLADGRRDLQPGIQVVKPLLPEEKYKRLSDHLPVVLTLRVPAADAAEQHVGPIRIVAAEPNPPGDDTETENVHLKNATSAPISLLGWEIRDASGRGWKIDDQDLAALVDKKLKPGETVIIRRRGREMALTNSGDSISLVDPRGKSVDVRTYMDAGSGELLRFE